MLIFLTLASKQVLSNINFDLHHGDFIGIVGPSGAGKSTIGSLITKYYDINSGEIMLMEYRLLN